MFPAQEACAAFQVSYSIPNSFANAFHLPSTNAFVFASMTISSGQGRVKPPVGHLRVASISILKDWANAERCYAYNRVDKSEAN